LHLRVLGVAFFVWLPLCVLYQFKMPFILIVLAFTFQGALRAMLKVFTLMLTLSPRLTRLLCFCRCLPLLWYTLVLSLLFLEVDFGLSLTSFWVCLKFILHAFICFIRSFEPFRMKSRRFFAYFLLNCPISNGRINMVPSLPLAMLLFTLYLKRSLRSKRGLFSSLEVYGGRLVFSLGEVLSCFTCSPFPLLFGQLFDRLSLPMFDFA